MNSVQGRFKSKSSQATQKHIKIIISDQIPSNNDKKHVYLNAVDLKLVHIFINRKLLKIFKFGPVGKCIVTGTGFPH